MNRMERLTAILLLLQDKPRTSEEIAGRFEVSKRTVLRDVQALSEMGMPVIARDGARGGYSLPDDFELTPLPLTRNEVFLLMLSLQAVNSLSDTPFAAERESLMAKLRTNLAGQLPDVEPFLDKVFVDVPRRRERAPLLEGFVEAAGAEKWVRIAYTSAGLASTQHILPRTIYTLNGFWYCRAYSHERNDYRVYRVDRVESLCLPSEDFQPYLPPQPQPYDFESNPEVIATLTPRGVAMAESEPHLVDRVIRSDNGWGTLAFRCPASELNYYARWFAGFGPEVRVEGPEELRSRLLEIGQKLVANYEKR